MNQDMWMGLATVFATLFGPIFAVQAQKYIEGKRMLNDQKMRIFTSLMATRASRLSPEHVQALNMIDLAFNGGRGKRRKTETDVLDAWRDYLGHLATELNEQNSGRWHETQNDRLITLLSAMAADVGLRYDRVLLRNGAYIPQGYLNVEAEQHALRKQALKVLAGEQPLAMSVESFPVDDDFARSQMALHSGIAALLKGEGNVRVHIDQNPTPPVPE